ncbi:MAG: helicase PcrA [Planctomycetota bacterium]
MRYSLKTHMPRPDQGQGRLWEPEQRPAAESATDAARPAGARAQAGSEPPRAAPAPPVAAREGAGDLLAGLNAAQREAVLVERGPLLILAGPGSGKTRVVTRRIARLARDCGVEPWRILAITFTNKAAREMKERVERLVPAQGMWISTFHAMCARILRRDIEMLGGWTRDFTIYDTSDRNQLLKKLIKEADYDPTRFRPALVGAWISDRKNRPTEQVHAPDGMEIELEVLDKVARAYEEAMRRQNALDFDDLLLVVLRLFDEHPGLRDSYAHRFLHVMVDEYQDTNHAQYLLARHLASAHGNLAVCGDPDQSIYAWRGADIRNILDFERDWPEARVVRLEQNYRSTMTILRAAQALIEKNSARKPKDLWSERGEGEPIGLLTCADENDEAEAIAERIRSHLRAGAKAGDIAVFYRVNFMQRALESALRLARVPYQVVGGLEFYERREIKDLVAFAKLAVNPADDLAFLRVVNTPQRGVGDKSLEQLAAFAKDRRIPLSRAVRSKEALALVRGRARGGLEGFAALLDKLAELKDLDAGVAFGQILELVGREQWLAEMDDDQAVDRESNVEELLVHAEQYDLLASARAQEAREGDEAPRGLRGFLQEIALVADVDQLPDAEAEGGKATLMTLHSAKGLEFPIVFVAGCEEELLPHVRALQDGGDEAVEEERRLFYVGVTRAQEKLWLSHAQTRNHFGQFSYREPSRFLAEIPGGAAAEEPADERGVEEMLGRFEPTSTNLKVGDRVEHGHFGRGTIEALQGAGANARAKVRFPAHGVKDLLLQYAKLTKLA